jgi:hypothetical protein
MKSLRNQNERPYPSRRKPTFKISKIDKKTKDTTKSK